MHWRRASTTLVAVAVALVGTGVTGIRPLPSSDDDGRVAEAAVRSTVLSASAKSAVRSKALTRAKRQRLAWNAPLEFGIYPGGGAGSVNARGEPRPENPALRQAAIDRLRKPNAGFTVHLYDAYTGPGDVAKTPAWLAEQIASYGAAGVRVELVLRYRPKRAQGDVPGFTRFVRSRVRELGPNPALTALQITNEANVPGAPDAADGAYRGALDALVRGVIAAKRESSARGYGQVGIGFNWADEVGPRGSAFFSALRKAGGEQFRSSVDWVGVDAYPGTWGPALPSGDLESAVAAATKATLSRLRGTLLPAAGLASVPIVFAENGYPTDHGTRTQADQARMMTAAIESIVATRRQYGVVGYRWFDLRDADSSVGHFESQYGLMRDDYSPKAAFGVYQRLVAAHG